MRFIKQITYSLICANQTYISLLCNRAKNERTQQHCCTNDWRRFADSLEFEGWIIKTINVKYKNYPEECCEEVLHDWLSLVMVELGQLY